ncbi:MAG: HAMP domain-containing histidine kinase [Actinomycetaceae bacterium]|nr:HAMP domain-containing histidine kinase [Actinomycetaceae bacterium]
MRTYALRMTFSIAAASFLVLGIPGMAVGTIFLDHLHEAGKITADEARVYFWWYNGGALLGMAVMALLASVIARHASRKLSRPLIFLAAAAEQLGAGQTRPQIKKTGFEEIDLVYDELRRSSDRMAGRISAERQFASDASHQLRTPLTALSMRLEEIHMLAKQEDIRTEAQQCLVQVERLTDVVSQLLEQSRSHAGGATEVVRLDGIFDQQREEWSPSFASVGRTLRLRDEARLPVLATPVSVAQIVATLIENSLKYGRGTTTVTTRKAGGKGVILTVSDEGDGVADDLVDAIFRKGVSTGGSTGYGLAIARQLADVDGARLELAQARPPIFSLTLSAVPQSLDPEKILPAGSLLSIGARRRRR